MSKTVELVWEEGNQIRRIKCEIIDFNNEFITVKTLKKKLKINKSKIIKIEEDFENV